MSNTAEWHYREGVGAISAAIEMMTGEYPAANNGAEYQNDTFLMRSYCWCDEDECEREVNFHHFASGAKFSWYKHADRGFVVHSSPNGNWWEIVAESLLSVVNL